MKPGLLSVLIGVCIVASLVGAATLDEYNAFLDHPLRADPAPFFMQARRAAMMNQQQAEFVTRAVANAKTSVQITNHVVNTSTVASAPTFGPLDNDDDDDDDHDRPGFGRLGREYARLLTKAAKDAATVRTLYTVPIWDAANPTGNCEVYANGAPVPATVMRPNSFGRIHPVGSFTDAEQSKEYFLLACPLLDRPLDSQVRVFRVIFKRLTAWNDRVWIEVVLQLSVPALNFFFNHTHTGYFEMDANSTICGYKLYFQRLELRDPAPETQTDAVLNGRIQTMCTNVVRDCANSTAAPADKYQPTATQTGVEVCVAHNSAPGRKARNGYQYVDQDGLRCREFHYGLVTQNLARHLPDHVAKHCAHSGPLGGGKCVDHPFDTFQNDIVSCAV